MAVSKRLRYEVLKRDNHTCRYCGATAAESPLTVDHVRPVALGGSDEPSNLVACCRDCNAGKTSTSPDEPLVDDVAQDALRWRKAIEVANEMAQRDREAMKVQIAAFKAAWDEWTYPSYDITERKTVRKTFDLPGGWEGKVSDLITAGLTQPDMIEAVHIAMGAYKVKDEFSYFVGVCRQKISTRQAVAQELIRRGLV